MRCKTVVLLNLVSSSKLIYMLVPTFHCWEQASRFRRLGQQFPRFYSEGWELLTQVLQVDASLFTKSSSVISQRNFKKIVGLINLRSSRYATAVMQIFTPNQLYKTKG